MLYIIGLGLSDEKDITVKGLEVRRYLTRHRSAVSLMCGMSGDKAKREGVPRVVHFDPDDSQGETREVLSPTPITISGQQAVMIGRWRLWADRSALRQETFYGREVISATRETVELESDDILRDADKVDVAFLVVGDPLG